MTTKATLNWTAPTSSTSGGPLTTPLAHYEVQYFTDNTQNVHTPVIVSKDDTSTVITGIEEGLMGFRIKAVDEAGNSSAFTQYVNHDTTPYPPNEPTDFSVTVEKG